MMGTRSPLGQFHLIFIANNSKRFKKAERRATQESFHALLRAQDKLTKVKGQTLSNTNTSKKCLPIIGSPFIIKRIFENTVRVFEKIFNFAVNEKITLRL